ncbi:Hypothetical protein FBFL15_0746 [Flavobacterium branchiophilum FL-15]|uniref:PD-(D/E)XK nuclease family transposase n=1 Tax=Flavobacterium branchiophilum (strain FL-15) TaxID=1034807 RepID=G2Z6L2_FLABF|nr:hypothetical protein [Flavobacterium branchiophilum]CCB68854.1 Hypothetical protein FBFL15_0746 [Flavobacterium branchiophilum FL-15]
MIIANPIYDVVFKRMMENERVAKFFIGTLLDQTIESIEVKQQEFTFMKHLDLDDPKVQEFVAKKINERLLINVMRLDFVATIKTDTGEYKKILIEIQKAKHQIDLMRFRNYLAEQYKREDKILETAAPLPITTIYVLGFNLSEITSPCIKVERQYKDLIEQKVINEKSDFVEKLTHDSYVVQVNRITNRFQTRLDKMLSVFEQNHFTDEKEIVKVFEHQIDSEDLKLTTSILHHAGTDPKDRKELEDEQEAWRTIDALTGNIRHKTDQLLQIISEKEQALLENEKIISEKEQALLENEKIISEKAQALLENEKIISEKDQALKDKDKENEALKQQIALLMNKKDK